MSGWFDGQKGELLDTKDLVIGMSLRSPKGTRWVIENIKTHGHVRTFSMRKEGAGPVVMRKLPDMRGWQIMT